MSFTHWSPTYIKKEKENTANWHTMLDNEKTTTKKMTCEKCVWILCQIHTSPQTNMYVCGSVNN